ncbi:hypothetical protein WJX72_000304 [[Myrmecia] bisecta]|uniref:Uncharacterized protein n=1 Tax=[Myrmecia] bisecta TaxID=41462 RepID=A0AAW1Q364_9CHLO
MPAATTPVMHFGQMFGKTQTYGNEPVTCGDIVLAPVTESHKALSHQDRCRLPLHEIIKDPTSLAYAEQLRTHQTTTPRADVHQQVSVETMKQMRVSANFNIATIAGSADTNRTKRFFFQASNVRTISLDRKGDLAEVIQQANFKDNSPFRQFVVIRKPSLFKPNKETCIFLATEVDVADEVTLYAVDERSAHVRGNIGAREPSAAQKLEAGAEGSQRMNRTLYAHAVAHTLPDGSKQPVVFGAKMMTVNMLVVKTVSGQSGPHVSLDNLPASSSATSGSNTPPLNSRKRPAVTPLSALPLEERPDVPSQPAAPTAAPGSNTQMRPGQLLQQIIDKYGGPPPDGANMNWNQPSPTVERVQGNTSNDAQT